MVAQLLDTQAIPFFYSTKLGSQTDLPGRHIAGAKDAPSLISFCKDEGIRLLVDAAHPFAEELHLTIRSVADSLGLTVLRVERSYPILSSYPHVEVFASYHDIVQRLRLQPVEPILALTGVQTIVKLRDVWEKLPCYFRILNTSQSSRVAQESGIAPEQVVQDSEPESHGRLAALIAQTGARLMITKESGITGGMALKLSLTQQLGIPLWVVARPQLPTFDYVVSDKKELLKTVLLLQKELLKTEVLRTGFTTGTCVCAAAKGCIIAMEEGEFPETVSLFTADGTEARFTIFAHKRQPNSASCSVIKNSGDDPDVTHAKEVGCTISYSDTQGIAFGRGVGVGVVTLPGLQVAVGEPAINPGPRMQIAKMVNEMVDHYAIPHGLVVEPFIPEGEEVAKRTFNGRVGVVGGISILGTTGRIFPYSSEAFLGALRQQIRVACSMGLTHLVATSGKRSETILKPFAPHLPAQGFIHFGNFVGETISTACQEGITSLTIGIMLGKAVKLAEGNLDTHSREVVFNPQLISSMASNLGYSDNICNQLAGLTLANAIPDIIPFSPTETLYLQMALRCLSVCKEVAGARASIRLALIVGNEIPLIVE